MRAGVGAVRGSPPGWRAQAIAVVGVLLLTAVAGTAQELESAQEPQIEYRGAAIVCMEQDEGWCKPGYKSDGCGYCVDIDECKDSYYKSCCTNIGAICKNTKGSFKCECSSNKEMVKGKCVQKAKKKCTYKGKTVKHGATVDAADGCNRCTCYDGTVECTKKKCYVGCEYQGGTIPDGSVVPSSDGCGKCTCKGSKLSCTNESCATACDTNCTPKENNDCQYNGAKVKHGKSVTAKDGCNKCNCKNGKMSCTKNSCAPKKCKEGNKYYAHGETFTDKDGCNKCTCSDGKISCTRKNCPQPCWQNSKKYAHGKSVAASDGCSVCKCTDGTVVCDKSPCKNVCVYMGSQVGHGNKVYAQDGCNRCWCNSGKLSCSQLMCEQVGPCFATNECMGYRTIDDDQNSCRTSNGTIVSENTWITAADGCNMCVCQKGHLMCSTINCADMACNLPDGSVLPSGVRDIAMADGCNTCSCIAGMYTCTTDVCLPPRDCVLENGQTLLHGMNAFGANGCSNCTCLDGDVTCTLNPACQLPDDATRCPDAPPAQGGTCMWLGQQCGYDKFCEDCQCTGEETCAFGVAAMCRHSGWEVVTTASSCPNQSCTSQRYAPNLRLFGWWR